MDYGKVYGRPGRRIPRSGLPAGTLILPLIVGVVAVIVAAIEYVPFPGLPAPSERSQTADVRLVRDIAPEPLNEAPLPAEPLDASDEGPPQQAVLSSGHVAAGTEDAAPVDEAANEEEPTLPAGTETGPADADSLPVEGAAVGGGATPLDDPGAQGN